MRKLKFAWDVFVRNRKQFNASNDQDINMPSTLNLVAYGLIVLSVAAHLLIIALHGYLREYLGLNVVYKSLGPLLGLIILALMTWKDPRAADVHKRFSIAIFVFVAAVVTGFLAVNTLRSREINDLKAEIVVQKFRTDSLKTSTGLNIPLPMANLLQERGTVSAPFEGALMRPSCARSYSKQSQSGHGVANKWLNVPPPEQGRTNFNEKTPKDDSVNTNRTIPCPII